MLLDELDSLTIHNFEKVKETLESYADRFELIDLENYELTKIAYSAVSLIINNLQRPIIKPRKSRKKHE